MRKVLFGITIVALLIFTGFVMYQGTDGRLNVWGFTDISEENDVIDEKNMSLKNMIEVSYPQAKSTLDDSTTALQDNKKQYEEQAILFADSKYFKQTENYKHEFILTKIGNYADDNKVDVRILVSTNSNVKKLYDINFTLIGKYADIANYIYDIENDSKLGFKIEDFIMVSYVNAKDDGTNSTTNEVKANFNCKEISIDLKWLDENETVIPGIITRGNPFINSNTALTGEYANDTLDASRQQEGNQITGTQPETDTTENGADNENTTTGNGSATGTNPTGNNTTNSTNTTTGGTTSTEGTASGTTNGSTTGGTTNNSISGTSTGITDGTVQVDTGATQ